MSSPPLGKRQKILIFCDYYLPGYKAGGPIRSIFNFVKGICDEFQTNIITRDRDFGDTERYPEKETYGFESDVIYLSSSIVSYKIITSHLRLNKNCIIYLNSVFSFPYSIFPLIAVKIIGAKDRKVILNPRGELLEDALAINDIKKKIYLYVAKALRIYSDVWWQVTESDEEKQIAAIFKPKKKIFRIENLSQNNNAVGTPLFKSRNQLKMVYISRVTEKKNLLGTLNILKKLHGAINLDIFGPIDGDVYWGKCKKMIGELPENISVKYNGSIRHELVLSTLSNYHFMVLLSLCENYGHIISEAIDSCVPVIISDKTPWGKLGYNEFGYVIDLKDEKGAIDNLQEIVQWDNDAYLEQVKSVCKYKRVKNSKENGIRNKYLEMLLEVQAN